MHNARSNAAQIGLHVATKIQKTSKTGEFAMITERQAIARAELLNTLAEQERETGGCVQSVVFVR